MAIQANTNPPVSAQNWAQQASASAVSVGGIVGTAAPLRTRKTKNDRSSESWGLGELFEISSIQSGVEDGLQASIRDSIGTLNRLLADDQTNSALQRILGKPGDQGSVAHAVLDLTEAFAELAKSPGQSPDGVVHAAVSFTGKLKTATDQIQALRGKVDSEIGDTVEQANLILRQIADLNTRIAVGAATGSVADNFGAQRDAALNSLSGSMDFASFNRADGTVSVFTKNGTPLVCGTASQLAHEATAKIEPSMSLANGTLSGITVNGIEISGQITSGTLHALLKTRDSTLPNVQSQLDTLAQTLQSHINQVSNRAVAMRSLALPCRSARRFSPSRGQRFSLSGGDVMLTVLTAEGTVKARENLTSILRDHQAGLGLPDTGNWSVGQVASALDRWLNRCFGTTNERCAFIDDNGHFCIDFPRSATGSSLAIRDQRSGIYRSLSLADAEKPLGLIGPLTFTDGAGNILSTSLANPARTIQAADSLRAVARKLDGIDGLQAELIADDGGFFLQISSKTGSDMSVVPDSDGANLVRGLRLLPTPDQPGEDVVINHQTDAYGVSLTSSPHANATTALGLKGPLVLRDSSGSPIVHFDLDPGWTLAHLAQKINEASTNKNVTATVAASGNRVILKISPALGQQIGLDGEAGAYHTRQVSDFSAAGGTLTIAIAGATIGRLVIKPGDTLQAIADAVNAPNAPFAARGITAAACEVETWHYLEVASRWGGPLRFEGDMVGTAAGQIDLALNVRDKLGLYPPAHQVVSGFTNFLGLNDIFVADPPDAFDSKAPTGIFTSTASPGMAGHLSLNPRMCEQPEQLAETAFAQQMTELLRSEVNLASAGGLPRGTHSLPQYAEMIIATAAAQSQSTHTETVFQQTFLKGLSCQHSLLAGLDMNDTVSTLTTFQQAFQDASTIASTMKLFFGSLGTPVH
ncbi:FlgK family flagellar hook-associated protein [Telmatospirillum sp.]|uniref:FlgK family flagellar hook-associated protein n=1 Tax=Telmatospirillum sp. TaxID=2079197 RepID=UPI002849DFE2|nr:hypothetical protein [Telmatospirillum sp.]MDR3440786.1 hypothetical protein [Telmatospirillum sp.]